MRSLECQAGAASERHDACSGPLPSLSVTRNGPLPSLSAPRRQEPPTDKGRAEGLGFDPTFGAAWSVAQVPATTGNRFRMGGLGFGLPLSRLYARYFGAWGLGAGRPWAPALLRRRPRAVGMRRLAPARAVTLPCSPPLLPCDDRWGAGGEEHARLRHGHVPHAAPARQRGVAGDGCRRFYKTLARPLPVRDGSRASGPGARRSRDRAHRSARRDVAAGRALPAAPQRVTFFLWRACRCNTSPVRTRGDGETGLHSFPARSAACQPCLLHPSWGPRKIRQSSSPFPRNSKNTFPSQGPAHGNVFERPMSLAHLGSCCRNNRLRSLYRQ